MNPLSSLEAIVRGLFVGVFGCIALLTTPAGGLETTATPLPTDTMAPCTATPTGTLSLHSQCGADSRPECVLINPGAACNVRFECTCVACSSCPTGEVRDCPPEGECECRCAVPTPTPPATPTETPSLVCTPPSCPTGEVFYCPSECPGGCGTICVTPAPSPTPNWCSIPIQVIPSTGPPGTEVDASGTCYLLHSGREGMIYFDLELVATVRGDTVGEYQATFTVPAMASDGPHQVSLRAGDTVYGAVAFNVIPFCKGDCACVGDCDGDGAVRVEEIIRMVIIALNGDSSGDTCPHIAQWCAGSAVDISCLVEAVNHALQGCR